MDNKTYWEIENEYSRKNGSILGGGVIGGMLLGFSTYAGLNILATHNSNQNPFSDTPAIIQYKSMESTLLKLEREVISLSRDLPDNSYIQSAARKRQQRLEIRISEIESDMALVKSQPSFEEYEEWNREHLTPEDNPVWFAGPAAGVFVATMLGTIPFINRNCRRRDEELYLRQNQESQ